LKIGDWQTYEREMSDAAAAGDPTAMLMADHNWIRTIFDEMTRRMANDQSSIAELLPGLKEMATALDVHIRQEEDVYFPAVKPRVSGRAKTWIAAAFPEHEVIRMTEDDFLDAVERRRDLTTDFRSFHSALIQHLDNEEEFIFPEVTANLDHEAARGLTLEMQRLAGAVPEP
jgi:hemerythrin-like domain-containing protein